MNQVPWCAMKFAINNRQSHLRPLVFFWFLFLLPGHAVATNVINAAESQLQNYPEVIPGIIATGVSFQSSLPVNFIASNHYMSSMAVSAIPGSCNREEC